MLISFITEYPFVLAFILGLIPALVWLWFWLKEEEKKPEPARLITGVFVFGMITVILVVPIEKFLRTIVSSDTGEIIIWALAEEVIKCLAVLVVLYKNSEIDQPVDWPIYFVTIGLGFAALENTLFLINPLAVGSDTVTLLTGGLRFLGSTLLHAVSSGLIGISLGLSFYMGKIRKKLYLLIGKILQKGLKRLSLFCISTTLHRFVIG